MNLRQAGFRFVKRGDDFKWVHPLEMRSTDVDCTDMDDAQFEAFVRAGEVAA